MRKRRGVNSDLSGRGKLEFITLSFRTYIDFPIGKSYNLCRIFHSALMGRVTEFAQPREGRRGWERPVREAANDTPERPSDDGVFRR